MLGLVKHLSGCEETYVCGWVGGLAELQIVIAP